MLTIDDLFPGAPAVIGMIHLPALPGTPCASDTPLELIERACAEAELYRRAGVDGVIVENMHDRPYLRGAVGPEITATMAVACARVRERFGGPTGVQILAGANEAAIAVAHAAGLDFVRVEGFVFGHVADEGWLDACAGPLLRYRRRIGADGLPILADIKKKHAAHAATADVDLAETARAAEFFLADGLIVTGSATGRKCVLSELDAVCGATGLPVFAGSGVTAEDLPGLADRVRGVIVGSALKLGGDWRRELDIERVEDLVAAARSLRSAS